jgi:radical SAM protein with 4Fe4S-binding SPASM domain
MIGNHFSIILLPTNQCNVDCDYCFENKTRDRLTLEQLGHLMDKVFAHMVRSHIGALTIYWQGGEIMTMPPHWFEQAHALIAAAARAHGRHVEHSLQSNMIGYGRQWNRVIAEMFGNSVGTSMDYPNLHRKRFGRGPDDYTALWHRNILLAREAGIDISVIAVPNHGTLEVGAERFYTYFAEDLEITSFQVNTPFPGGEENAVKRSLPLDVDQLSRFFVDLTDVWLERGYHSGVRVGPMDELLRQFSGGWGRLPCIWQANCADQFVSIDARGHVAQCDCWVTSYPEYFFGNIFECDSFTELLRNSPARQQFLDRPKALIQGECLECEYLSLCHGGCPVRTYTFGGDLFEKDPYCGLYKALFRHVQDAAAQLTHGAYRAGRSERSAAPPREGSARGADPRPRDPFLIQLDEAPIVRQDSRRSTTMQTVRHPALR